MPIGRFNETGEDSPDIKENNERNIDNQDSPRNQILETPDDYTDDFDKKIEDTENKEDVKGAGESSGKDSPWDKFKSYFSKEGSEAPEEQNTDENKESASDRAKEFRESLKPENYEGQMDEPRENTDLNNTSESDVDPHEEPQRERSLFD